MLNIFSFEKKVEESNCLVYRKFEQLLYSHEIKDMMVQIISSALTGNFDCIDDIPFHDEVSKRLMKAIDGAEYVGVWEVETRYGITPLTSLSSGCCLGLLLIHFNKEKTKRLVHTNFVRAGSNVWQFLYNLDIDITFCISEYDDQTYSLDYCFDDMPVKYNGEVIECVSDIYENGDNNGFLKEKSLNSEHFNRLLCSQGSGINQGEAIPAIEFCETLRKSCYGHDMRKQVTEEDYGHLKSYMCRTVGYINSSYAFQSLYSFLGYPLDGSIVWTNRQITREMEAPHLLEFLIERAEVSKTDVFFIVANYDNKSPYLAHESDYVYLGVHLNYDTKVFTFMDGVQSKKYLYSFAISNNVR